MTERARPEDIEALVEIFQASDWKEMRLKYKDIDLLLSKDANAQIQRRTLRENGGDASPAATSRSTIAPKKLSASTGKADAGDATDTEDDAPGHWIPIKAPNIGTFYRAPKPGAPPYVELDQTVNPDTEICLIEVMKLFTALKAGVSGVVKRICAKDGELLESGQILFYIEPDDG